MTATPTPPAPAAAPVPPDSDDYVVTTRPPTADQLAVVTMSSRPLNPDTNLPMPSPSDRQRHLVAELLDRIGQSHDPANLVGQALTEAVVRQHGRTLRANIAEQRRHADGLAADARTLLTAALDGPTTLPPDPGKIGSAERLAAAAAVLRTAHLAGGQA